MRAFYIFITLFVIALTSCGKVQNTGSRLKAKSLTKSELLADFNQMVAYFEGLYAPMEYKKHHEFVKLDFEKLVKDSRIAINKSKTDKEAFAVFSKFTGAFKDGHVGIRFPMYDDHINAYKIGIFVMPVQDKNGQWQAVVTSVDDKIKGIKIKVGDTVVAVDDKPIFEYLPSIVSYKSYSNSVSDRHQIYRVFNRPAFMVDLTPKREVAKIEFRREESSQSYYENVTWNRSFDSSSNYDLITMPQRSMQFYFADAMDMNQTVQSPLKRMGDLNSFFATDEVYKKYHWQRVSIHEESKLLKKFKIDHENLAQVFAVKYRYKNKNVLMIRQPGYVPPMEDEEAPYEEALEEINRWIKTYKIIMTQEAETTDVLVIDQSHNPGGYVSFVTEFFRLFLRKEATNLVQLNHIDRDWIIGLNEEADWLDGQNRFADGQRSRAWAKVIERSGEQGLALSDPVTFEYDFWLSPFDDFKWEKPILFIADELAGSCGDIFPMLMKNNKIGKFFGQRTMGLGGNVISKELTNSKASVRLTRGLFTTYRGDVLKDYQGDDSIFAENNGVTPDIEYNHTLEDVRAGYVHYVSRFSDEALRLLKAK